MNNFVFRTRCPIDFDKIFINNIHIINFCEVILILVLFLSNFVICKSVLILDK